MVLDTSWHSVTQSYGHKGVTLFHWMAFTTGVVNFALNALIWAAFAKNPRLLSKFQLYLFYAFAVTNCLTGLATVPTYVNLFIHNNLNCPRWTILIGSSFEIAFEKIRAILTLSIAGERIHAICYPGTHYFTDHKKFALRVCAVAVIWGIFDSILLIFEDDIVAVRVHCVTTSSSGPFFHWYFLLTTILSGLLLTVVYIFLICRLFVIREYNNPLNRSTNRNSYRQINSLTITIILIVLIFSVLPCSLYLYDMAIGKVIFMQWGPIVTIGYHLYGILSFFFYNMKHRDIRESLRTTFPNAYRLFNFERDPKSITYIPVGRNPTISPAPLEVKISSTYDDVRL